MALISPHPTPRTQVWYVSCFVSMWRVSDGRDSSTHCGVSAPGPEWDVQEVWAQNRFACISVLGKGVNARDSGFGVSSFPHPRYCLPSPPGLACLSSVRPILSCHCTGTDDYFQGHPQQQGFYIWLMMLWPTICLLPSSPLLWRTASALGQTTAPVS